MKIKMIKTVRDTFAPAGTVLYSGSQYRAEKDNEIVYGICENGQKIPLENDVWEEVKT